MNNPGTHTLDCWAHAYRCARENGADAVLAFDWAAGYLDPAQSMEICRCDRTPRANRLSLRAYALTRA